MTTLDRDRATPAEVETARSLYADDDINIDPDALTARCSDGTWVEAWVWIPPTINPEEQKCPISELPSTTKCG